MSLREENSRLRLTSVDEKNLSYLSLTSSLLSFFDLLPPGLVRHLVPDRWTQFNGSLMASITSTIIILGNTETRHSESES